MREDIAIDASHVSKNFKLPHEKVTSVKSLFVQPFRSRRALKTETQHALRDISFEVKKGEFFGIVGRNGSGKSTLLKIIAGIYKPTEGRVSVNGRLVPFIELGVGFNPELTGRENVYLNGALMGFSTKDVDVMYDDIVSFAELEDFMDQKLKNYSSGMQVRLAFSVATRARADVLLIDEVLAVGDAAFQRKCFEYFKSLKKIQKTVIFVSHDMSAVREYCDRAALIEDSKLVAVGATNEIATMYEKLFIRKSSSASTDQSNGPRWGEGQAITDVATIDVSNEELVITQTVLANEEQSNLIIGFRLRDGAGREITGTNTKVECLDTGIFRAGDKKTVVWKLPNVLSDGDYYLDPAILLSDGITTADWWDEAASFTVSKRRRLPYNIDPDFEVEIGPFTK